MVYQVLVVFISRYIRFLLNTFSFPWPQGRVPLVSGVEPLISLSLGETTQLHTQGGRLLNKA